MAKKVKPFKAPKIKEQTPGEVLKELVARMPPKGKKLSAGQSGRMAGGGGRGHKKTAKTPEQIAKEVQAYGSEEKKQKRPADAIMRGKVKKAVKSPLKRVPIL